LPASPRRSDGGPSEDPCTGAEAHHDVVLSQFLGWWIAAHEQPVRDVAALGLPPRSRRRRLPLAAAAARRDPGPSRSVQVVESVVDSGPGAEAETGSRRDRQGRAADRAKSTCGQREDQVRFMSSPSLASRSRPPSPARDQTTEMPRANRTRRARSKFNADSARPAVRCSRERQKRGRAAKVLRLRQRRILTHRVSLTKSLPRRCLSSLRAYTHRRDGPECRFVRWESETSIQTADGQVEIDNLPVAVANVGWTFMRSRHV